jgi:hypothetical protein
LVTLDSSLPSFRSDGVRFKAEVQTLRRPGPVVTSPVDAFLPFVFGCQRARASGTGDRRRPGPEVPDELEWS